MLYNTQTTYYKKFLVNNGNASKKMDKMMKKGQAVSLLGLIDWFYVYEVCICIVTSSHSNNA